VADDSGSLRVVWFNQPFLIKVLKSGDEVFLSGKVGSDMLGTQLVSPTYERVSLTTAATPPDLPLERGGSETAPASSCLPASGGERGGSGNIHTARLVPIYPLTHGVTQKQMRFLINQVMVLVEKIEEWLPEKILENNDLIPLPAALHGIHAPVDDKDLVASIYRIKFGELFLLQAQAVRARLARQREKAPVLSFLQAQISDFVKGLPFTLTPSQKLSAWEILQDLEKPNPMNRLLSGDVGSGKTVVAAIAGYSAFLNHHQTAIMAPTEILAKQHFDSIGGLLEKYGVRVGLFTRSQIEYNFKIPNHQFETDFKNKKKELFKYISNQEVDVLIGTHALLSKEVEFAKLGLVVVDEQHRFGVEQRKEIKNKTISGQRMLPHFLSMTATPIPRSLALMYYGDLELSAITELPVGRKKIITRLVESQKRDRAYAFIREQVKAGRQVFVVCPIINLKANATDKKSADNEMEVLNYNFPGKAVDEKKSVMSEYEKLSQKIFSDLRVSFLHGKLKEKDQIMDDFKAGKYDILVTTSVVEVGVDVPNAAVMMIEGADRFGLAQLHQFRGRVGRSHHQSYCLLFTDNNTPTVLERLKYFEQNNSGFKLAEKDLATRGAGEVYGTEQSGMGQLRLAKITDLEIIKKARISAQTVASELNQYPLLKKKLGKKGIGVHWE